MILHMAQSTCFIAKQMVDVLMYKTGIVKLQCVSYMCCIFHIFNKCISGLVGYNDLAASPHQ